MQGFQQKFTFHSKEIVAISCSWCKQAVSIFGKVSHHIISPDIENLIEYFIKWTSCTAFFLPVSQQNILLHAAADWRALSNRSSCCSCSSSHLDNSGSTASGDNYSTHLFKIFWKILNESNLHLFVSHSLLWSRVRKRREHHSRGKAARKELRSVLL